MDFEDIAVRVFVGAGVLIAVSIASILLGIALKIWGVLPI